MNKDQILVEAFREELVRVQEMFRKGKRNPPLHKNTPPVVSKLIWVHALKRKDRCKNVC